MASYAGEKAIPVATESPDSNSDEHKGAAHYVENTGSQADGVCRDALRVDGDNLDHETEPEMTLRRFMSLLAMSLLFVGSQIPVYLFGSIPPYIYRDIGGSDRWIWFILGNLLALAGKRGAYVAVLVFTVLPFVPSSLYAQLIASHATWRYCGLIICVWNGLALIITSVFYFPPPRPNSMGKTKKQVLAEIDYVGGLLSVSGLVLFLAGMQWGGYQYKWKSVHVLVPLLIGSVLIIAFVIWEAWFAKHPMFPRRLKQNPRILALTLLITFISGANFFSYLMFWPTQSYNVYGHDPLQVGLRTLPPALAILTGACVVLALLSYFRGRNKELMIISCLLMTSGTGALACATPYNMNKLWGLLILGGLGIGGIVVPASIISTIICPDDLIATVSALTLSIRVVGGCVGYCAYYNVLVGKFTPNALKYIAAPMVEAGITNMTVITEAILLTSASLLDEIKALPGLQDETLYNAVVEGGRMAYSESYKYVYLGSIAAGSVSIIAAFCLGEIDQYMDEHVAVIM
ncbi:hypothetical protein DV737_g4655, partial [Chaetothyriales sp. CBS 132003]